MILVKGLNLGKERAAIASVNDRQSNIIFSGCAGWAGAEQKNLMPFNNKTWWCRFLLVQSASRQLINPVASVTMEMMVMTFPCPFI